MPSKSKAFEVHDLTAQHLTAPKGLPRLVKACQGLHLWHVSRREAVHSLRLRAGCDLTFSLCLGKQGVQVAAQPIPDGLIGTQP